MAAHKTESKCELDLNASTPPPLADSPDPELDMYCYTALTSATSIRLLELHPSGVGEILCSLTTVDLDQLPIFDALSYTWGNPITVLEKPDEAPLLRNFQQLVAETEAQAPEENREQTVINLDLDAYLYRLRHPFVPYEEVNWNSERCVPITCNDRTVMVSGNLFDALFSYRRIVVNEIAEGNDFNGIYGGPRTRYLWIDAICINQEDVPERNAQVAIMDRIFGGAQCVFGWLGPADSLSRLGCHTLAKLYSVITEGGEPKQGFLGSLYAFPGIDEKEWLAIFALLQRLWFRRAWIVQEAVLAQQLIMFCGGVMFRWSILDEVVRFMTASRLDEKVTDLAMRLMQGGPASKFSIGLLNAGITVLGMQSPHVQTSRKSFLVDPKASYAFVAGVRMMRECLGILKEVILPLLNDDQRQSKKRITIVSGDGERPISLLSLLSTFRACDATDQRDKIFAFLGILSKQGALGDNIFKADYGRSVQEVYIAAAKSILQSRKDLKLLSHVQDPSLTRVSGLPSWVPDYSVDLGRAAFEPEEQSPWSASGKHQVSRFEIRGDYKLVVDGFLLDTVSYLASLKGCTFVRNANVVLQTPAWYRDQPGEYVAYRPDFVDEICQPVNIPVMHKASSSNDQIPTRPVTRVEALWRTMTADCFDGQHPAPIRCGFGFSDWICLQIRRAENFVGICQKDTRVDQESVQIGFRKLKEKLNSWALLDEGENGGYYSLSELENLKETLQKHLDESDNAETRGLQIDLDAGGVRFLPDTERVIAFRRCQGLGDKSQGHDHSDGGILTGCIDQAPLHHLEPVDNDRVASFETRVAEVKKCRRMFHTEKKYFGIGPQSIEVGDEVWLLRGANVPFVLRRLEVGNYQVIGEVYVHGVMHGEALKDVADPFSQIVLQ